MKNKLQIIPIPVEITKKHLQKGQRQTHDGCPIYLALSEKYPDFLFEVMDDCIEIDDNFRINCNEETENWIQEWDTGEKEMKPTTLHINLPAFLL